METPRWLGPEAAAKYISVRVDALARLVRQNRIPKPNYDLGPRSPRWDRLALDAAFGGGLDSNNVDVVTNAIVQKILASKGRARRSPRDEGRNH